ncbi:MAG: hypothetical protein KF746_22795 [Chitinophagaceae bacterium]|nr:hypothetical protein [Chitinophagaceae bacterium]
MKKIKTVAPIALVVFSACNSNTSWNQQQRDQLVKECEEKAIVAMTADGQTPDEATKKKLASYCSCYQQNLEKQFPSAGAMEKANAGDVANAAKDCLQLMAQ